MNIHNDYNIVGIDNKVGKDIITSNHKNSHDKISDISFDNENIHNPSFSDESTDKKSEYVPFSSENPANNLLCNLGQIGYKIYQSNPHIISDALMKNITIAFAMLPDLEDMGSICSASFGVHAQYQNGNDIYFEMHFSAHNQIKYSFLNSDFNFVKEYTLPLSDDGKELAQGELQQKHYSDFIKYINEIGTASDLIIEEIFLDFNSHNDGIGNVVHVYANESIIILV